MVGITSYGAYVPIYRLNRSELARAWAGGAPSGERSVANWDEDSVTMGVAAALDCLKGIDHKLVDSLYFATTTSPFQESQCSTILTTATNMRRDVFSGDFSNSLRSGTIALKAAIDAVKAGSAKRALVVASDSRLGEPKSEYERLFGDGAAAVMVGDSDVIASIEGAYSHSDEIYDNWRTTKDDMVKMWEDRFVLTRGYELNFREAVSGIMNKHGLQMKDFAKVVYYAPDERRHRDMAKELGLGKGQTQEPMFDRLGNTGCAFALMMLVSALEEAKPGDKILFVNYGNGADAFILQVTDEIEKSRDHKGVKGHLASKMQLPNYESYIRFRELMPVEMQRRPMVVSSAVQLWRGREWIFGANASRCRRCGKHQFPPQRVCLGCQSKDDFDLVDISGWKGELFTFAKDNLALCPDPPVILSIADFEKKVRFYSRMTDRDPEKIEVGMPLELTFRKIHEGAGFPNYFWKPRPTR
jgi:hydroxymethylglutaryl-CoA synthase